MDKSNIVLSGFMASGKSTVGEILSGDTGMALVDTDGMVEASAGASVEQIFESGGERRFREYERTAVSRAASKVNVIIAVGGGAVLDERNVTLLKRAGVMYLLDVSPEEVYRRAGGGCGRPLLGKEKSEVEELVRVRHGVYMEAADVVVETTGRTPAEVAREIAADFRSRAAGRPDGP
ncbi:MAG: shikimate kinase [Actinomycetia bacterium]|nr:shikimate kinase [Actinomycetes bacterium]